MVLCTGSKSLRGHTAVAAALGQLHRKLDTDLLCFSSSRHIKLSDRIVNTIPLNAQVNELDK